MARYREYQSVKLTSAHQGADAYLGGDVCHLPAGQVGTILAILGGGNALEVDFILREPVFASSGEVLDYGHSCTVTLTPDQVVPAN